MTGQIQKAPDLAALLHRHQDEIATTWAEMAQRLPGTPYREHPFEKVRSWLSRGVQAIAETLSTGSYQPTEDHLRDISLTRLQLGFDIAEVIEGLLLFKEAALPLIRRTYPTGSTKAYEAVACLDAYLRFMLGRFGHLYAQMMTRHLQAQQERTALILETVETVSSSLKLDQVLQRIAEKGSAILGLGCNLYLWDEEQKVLIPRARSGYPDKAHDSAFHKLYLSPDSCPLIHEILEHNKTLVSYNAAVDARFSPKMVEVLGLKSTLAVPIAADEQILGAVVYSTVDECHHFTEQDIELIEGLVNAVGLAVHNAQLYEQTRQRLEELKSLQRVTTALLQKLSLEEMLEIVRREACQLTGAKGCVLLALKDDGRLEVVHSGGDLKSSAARIPVKDTLTGRVVLCGKPLFINDPNELAQTCHPVPNLESLLIIPMRLKGTIVGTLDVANKPGGFTQDDIRVLSLFADGAAIAIESARLHQQAEQLAVVEERQRLARELHDSVTQSLYSVTLYAEATRMAMSAGKQDVAAENLQELHDMARQAMLDMRMLIFELHPPVLEKEGLVAALQARLAAVESRAGLQTEIHVEGAERLPLSVEEELFWIALEAFNNVVKHANARQVKVHLQFDGQNACLEIKDNGAGFDPAEARESGGMGLRGIDERAQQLKGKLEIQSAPGQGTTLRVETKI